MAVLRITVGQRILTKNYDYGLFGPVHGLLCIGKDGKKDIRVDIKKITGDKCTGAVNTLEPKRIANLLIKKEGWTEVTEEVAA